MRWYPSRHLQRVKRSRSIVSRSVRFPPIPASSLHPIADTGSLKHHAEMGPDPFRDEITRDRVTQAVGVLLLLAFLSALILVVPLNDFRRAKSIHAVVLRLGTYPDETAGDLPILTLRMRNGSIRQVRTSWSGAKWCAPGTRVWLLQRGSNLQVALRGCERRP